jgi:hypothetical protein
MSIEYGLNMINQNLIVEKARTKKDGVYRFRGIVYRVKNNKVTHVSDADVILECYGHFNVQVARVPSDERVQDYMKRCIKD